MNHSRIGAACFTVTGLLFVGYPAVRPYSDEMTMDGARAIASTVWIAAHLLAVAGFVLLGLSLLALRDEVGPGAGRGLAGVAVVLGWIGAGLTLPYYGAEVFGLHAIAARAVQDGSPALLELTDAVRYQLAAVTMFGLGLVLLAAAVVLAAVAIGRSRIQPRWVGVPLAVGFVLFIPQFFAPPALRILHGVLVAVGAIMVAAALWRAPPTLTRS